MAAPFGTPRTVTGVSPRGMPLTDTAAPAGSLRISRMPESRISFSWRTSGVRPENFTSTVRGW